MPKIVLGIIAAGLSLSAGSGCEMHNMPCYRACMDLHRHCVTRSQTSYELEQCDVRLEQCRRGCR